VSWVLAWPSWCCTCAGLSPCGSRSEAKVWRRQCGGKCSASSAFFKTCRRSAHGEAPRTGARVTPAQRLRRPLDLEAQECTGGPLSKNLTTFGVVDDLAGDSSKKRISDGLIVIIACYRQPLPRPKAAGGPEEASAGRRSALQSHRNPPNRPDLHCHEILSIVSLFPGPKLPEVPRGPRRDVEGPYRRTGIPNRPDLHCREILSINKKLCNTTHMRALLA